MDCTMQQKSVGEKMEGRKRRREVETGVMPLPLAIHVHDSIMICSELRCNVVIVKWWWCCWGGEGKHVGGDSVMASGGHNMHTLPEP